MITLTLKGLTPKEDINNASLTFSKDYFRGNISCYGGDSLTYPEAMRIFAALNLTYQSSALTERVKALSSQAAEVADKMKTALDSYIWEKYVAVSKEILGSELYGFKIQLAGERYQDHPFDQLLCELVARENGFEYSAPTLDQFHRYVANRLAKFVAPYKEKEHLITQTDLRKIYIQHLDSRPEMSVPLEVHFVTIQRYIAEEANTSNVALRVLTAQEFKAKAASASASSCTCPTCTIFLELTIDSQVRYIEFHDQDDAFRFVPALNNSRP